ncbi:transposable element gene [Prunus dulcis]|uniref:Transposable element protein n=1 Tax=Prunus dulcis TaxID=3755 RepID=A0A4Y1RE71_PRUDU|nr:transposable element gene [Prunus dulcis]
MRYYQVKIAPRDELKTACVTRYWSYEFLVMSFGLTNTPATFCTLMNKVFPPLLDKFVVVCINDIVVYSNSLEKHLEYLQRVFQVLRENKLYVKKKKKYSFVQEEVEFISHKIRDVAVDDTMLTCLRPVEEVIYGGTSAETSRS